MIRCLPPHLPLSTLQGKPNISSKQEVKISVSTGPHGSEYCSPASKIRQLPSKIKIVETIISNVLQSDLERSTSLWLVMYYTFTFMSECSDWVLIVLFNIDSIAIFLWATGS